MIVKMTKCPYCGVNIKVTAEDAFAVCGYCGREMEIPRFTQEEKRLTEAVEELRVSTEAAEAAVYAAVELAKETDEQLEARIARLVEQQAEDSVQARMHREELHAQRMAEAREARNEARAHVEALKGEHERTRAELNKMNNQLKASKDASLQHRYALGEAAQRAGRFDEAIKHFQELVVQSEQREAEVHWRIVLCRYGVEYVKEQSSGIYLPTITHMIVDSIQEDADCRAAIDCARSERMRSYYMEESRRIDAILDKYRLIYSQEKPYDVFISVKQGDVEGRPTQDSMIGMDLYHMLTDMGLHVFNSRISLSKYAGLEYEPYIMAALMTSKVMIVVGSSGDYLNAPWLRNEWRRFRWLLENGEKGERRLISYIMGMQVSEVPKELGVLQIINAQTALDPAGQLREVMEKAFGEKVKGNSEQKNLLLRAEMLLEDGETGGCDECLDEILKRDAKCGKAHALKLCIEMGVSSIDALAGLPRPIDGSKNYIRAVQYGDAELKQQLEGIVRSMQERDQKIAYLNNLAREHYSRGNYEEAASAYREAADLGNAKAMNNLGVCCENGTGVPKDVRKAAELYRRAAELGSTDGMKNLGMCYEAGDGVSKDVQEAAKLYRRAADLGDADAMKRLGVCYASGIGVPEDPQEAVKWYLKAAERGDTEAMNNLGVCHINGSGVPVDLRKAEHWYLKAAEQGVAVSMYNLGKLYKDGIDGTPDMQEAAEWFRKGAKLGEMDAMYSLGDCYYSGDGVKQDMEQAAKWYRKAAELGCVGAMNNLGARYYNGEGVDQDYREAEKWVRKAAELGDAAAMNNLGLFYAQGRGVDQDDQEAAKWFRKAAELGRAGAMNDLAMCYYHGRGMARDYREAVKWLRKAAELGDADAMSNLGLCYYHGQGVPKNLKEAMKWFLQAAENGHVQAMHNVATMLKEGQGVPKNHAEANKWYLRAAENGHADAMRSLGFQHLKGNGVPVNREEAVRWIRKSADLGNAEAIFNLGECYENAIGVQKDLSQAKELYSRAAELGHKEAKKRLAELEKIPNEPLLSKLATFFRNMEK